MSRRGTNTGASGGRHRRWTVALAVSLLSTALVAAPAGAQASEPDLDLVVDHPDAWVADDGSSPSWPLAPEGPCEDTLDALLEDETRAAGRYTGIVPGCIDAPGHRLLRLDGLLLTGEDPVWRPSFGAGLRCVGEGTRCRSRTRLRTFSDPALEDRRVVSWDAAFDIEVAADGTADPPRHERSYLLEDEVDVTSLGSHNLFTADLLLDASVELGGHPEADTSQVVNYLSWHLSDVRFLQPELHALGEVPAGTVTLDAPGVDLAPAAEVTVSGDGVEVLDVEHTSPDDPLRITLTVAPDAAAGPRDVTLAHPFADYRRTCAGCLVVAPPRIDRVAPTGAEAATTGQLTVRGSGFGADTTVAIDGVELSDLAVSRTLLVADLAVAPDAAPGPRDVTVTSRGASAVCPGCFTITEPGPEPEPMPTLDEAIAQVCDDVAPVAFPDVAGAHAHAIGCLAGAGIVHGYPDGRFGPSEHVTRAQLASLIDRLVTTASGSTLTSDRATFPDVGSSPHAEAIDRLTASGIVAGYPDGTFRPSRPVTRGEAATLVDRARRLLADGSIEHGTHEAAIVRLTEEGIVAGYPDGSLRPHEPITRAQTATVLLRTAGWLHAHDVWHASS